MKALAASEIIARLLREGVEKCAHTGSVDIHLDCNQGAIRIVQAAITESKTSVFKFSSVPSDTQVVELKEV
jgi:hypothetical protein